MSITLNEEQREQFGALQAQYQGLRKQLTSVAAQVEKTPSVQLPPCSRSAGCGCRGCGKELAPPVPLLWSSGSVCGTARVCASIRRYSARLHR